jgi:exoribonuclease-2
VSAFDAAYSAYADFQSNMERFWCLRWLSQQNAKHIDAVVLKEEVLRLVDIPLIIKLPGMSQAARGTQVRLDLIRWDEVDLSVEVRLLEIGTATPAGDDEITTTESETDAESIPE